MASEDDACVQRELFFILCYWEFMCEGGSPGGSGYCPVHFFVLLANEAC